MKRLKLLWAEDDESQREVIVDIAAVLKHDVDISIHGKDALDQLGKNKYDVLITDISMPVMDGWELLEAIKGKYPRMKIIVMSGWVGMIGNEKYKELGVSAVFAKPFQISALKKELDKYVCDGD